MINVSETFLNKIKQNNRGISGKLYLGNLELIDEDLISMDMEYSLGNDNIPAIGGVVASRLDVKLFRDKLPPVFTTQELKPHIGLEISPGIIEYIPMGVFRINSKDTIKTDKTITLVGYDILYILEDSPYESNLTFPASWNQIKAELETKGLRFKVQSLQNVTIKEKPNTIRELLSDVAEILGMNVVSNRSGEVEFRGLTTTTFEFDNHKSFKLLADDEVKLTRLTVEKEDNNLTHGNDSGFTIKIKNDSITTESELTTAYNRAFPLSYIAYECEVKGYPHLDVGDIVKVIDRHGVERSVPVVYHKIRYSGGLMSEIRANAPSGAVSSTGSTGSNAITQSLNNLRINILEVNHILADKADLNLVVANEAKITDLYAVKANVNDLEAVNIRVGVLEAGSADISVLESDVARINTLLAGNLDATNMKAGFITADSGLISSLAITNAMIANMDVAKINAGDISTSKFRVVSDSGNLRIQDNTIQIADNVRTRVQIGKDASNDYNMYVWDSNGKLMFDATGLHADGIKNPIIRDDMVSPNANISGDKLNISSVVTAINDGVTKIESSHINYDGKSLNVAFGEFESGLEDRVKITDFQIEQGRINALISDVSTIEGEVNSTKSRVSTVEQTVGSISTAISELETDIDNTKSNLSALTQDVNSFKTTVSQTYATKNELSTKESQIKQYADQVGISVVNTVTSTYETIENVNQKINTAKGEILVTTDAIDLRVSNMESEIDSITQHSIVLSNENASYPTDPYGVNISEVTISSDVSLFKGTTRIAGSVTAEIIRFYAGGLSELIPIELYGAQLSITQPTSQDDGKVVFNIDANKNIPYDLFYIELNITIESVLYRKYISISKSKAGVMGEDGTPGTPAKLVTITPNQIYFIRKQSGITPDTIILTPNFQNCTYQKWEYSINGTTWTAITRTTSSTTLPWMNSSTRVLTIPKAWAILASNNNVIFRVTTTTGEMDVQTISILYDVSELESRVNTAEQKITPTAIMQTVENQVATGDSTIAQKSDITQTMDEWVAKFDYLKEHKEIKARYIRSHMRLTTSGVTDASFWAELVVMSNGVNVAQGRTPTLGGGAGGSAITIIGFYTDGNKTTYYQRANQTAGLIPYLQVDLGNVRTIDSIEDVLVPAGILGSGTLNYYYKLEYSEDGTTWTTLYEDPDALYTAGKESGVMLDFRGYFQQGIVTINGEGVKVEHSGSNEWSMIRHDGFVRQHLHGEAKYLNDIFTHQESADDKTIIGNNIVRVPLPQRFRGRAGLIASVGIAGFNTIINSMGTTKYYGGQMETQLDCVIGGLDTSTPYVDVTANLITSYSDINNANRYTQIRPLGFTLTVTGG